MGKDHKKDFRKGFALQTTPQSNAFKEQINVLKLIFRDRIKFYFQIAMGSSPISWKLILIPTTFRSFARTIIR